MATSPRVVSTTHKHLVSENNSQVHRSSLYREPSSFEESAVTSWDSISSACCRACTPGKRNTSFHDAMAPSLIIINDGGMG